MPLAGSVLVGWLLGDLVELEAELAELEHLGLARLDGDLALDGLGVDADDLAVGQTLLQALDDLLLACEHDEGVDGALVELDRAVAVGGDGLEVGLVILDAGDNEALERTMTGELDPLGLVIAAGVAGQSCEKSK